MATANEFFSLRLRNKMKRFFCFFFFFFHLITHNRWRHRNEPISCCCVAAKNLRRVNVVAIDEALINGNWQVVTHRQHTEKKKENEKKKKVVFALMKSSTDDCLVAKDKIQRLFRSIESQMNEKEEEEKAHYTLTWWMWWVVNAEPVARRPYQWNDALQYG